MRRTLTRRSFLSAAGAAAAGLALAGCVNERADGKVEVEIVSYKQEAVSIFEQLQGGREHLRAAPGGVQRLPR